MKIDGNSSFFYLLKKISLRNLLTTVEPLLNGHSRRNGLWPLKRGWMLNGGRNNKIAIIGSLIALFASRLTEVAV